MTGKLAGNRLLAVLGLLSFCMAQSQHAHGMEKGMSEIGFLFSYSHQTVTVEGNEVVDPIDSVMLSGTYGYLLTSLFEPSIGLAGSYMRQAGEDTMIVDLTPGLLLNLTTLSKELVPYAGVRVGAAYVNLGGSEFGFVWSLGGGLRYMAAANVSLNFEAGYKQYILDVDGKSTHLDFIPISAGISVFF